VKVIAGKEQLNPSQPSLQVKDNKFERA